MKNNRMGELLSEFLGTGFLILLGDGVVATAVLFGAYGGQWQPSILWGLTVAAIVYIFGSVSGAHINPALTIANAAFRNFGWGKAFQYIAAQILGAFAGAALLHLLIAPVLAQQGLTATTATIFATYPGAGVPNANAFLIEVVLTMVLVLVILAINDERSSVAPQGGMGALIVGLTVALLVGVGGPWTMAAINPARDLGPRLWMAVAGWGNIALPGPNAYFWVPILGPLVGGGFLAGLVYDKLVRSAIPDTAEKDQAA